MSREDLDCKVYIGDLARDATEKDVERACSYYGHLKSVWVARNPAGFSFVEFEDPRDAEDAVSGLDGSMLNGARIRVEHSTGKIRPKPWLRGGRGGGGRDGGGRDSGGGRGGRRPFNPDDKCYQCGERGHYAYDCSRYNRGGGGGGGSRRYSRSRSRSRSRGRRSYSRGRRSHSRSRSRSRDRRGGGGGGGGRDRRRSRERYRSRTPVSRSRSRSRSPPPRNDHDD